jgi:DNA-binding transcriptional MerR regulator
MYTIGQVAKFLGVSRDTLKFYEEKKIVKPIQDAENGYRKYNQYDIYDVITTNFYREIDIEIKQIQKIRKSSSVEEIELVLEEKEQKILEEIKYKNLLLKRIKSVKEDCEKIKQHLGKYTIKEMKPLEVKGSITDFGAYDEYDILQKNTDGLKNTVTFTNIIRVISFDEEGITGEEFLVVRKVEDFDKDIKCKVLTHPKCIYTIVEDGRWLNGEENIDDKVGDSLKKIALEKGYEPLGLVYVNILLTTYEEELERKFIELYAPIK